jgi:hypothetical protein
MAARDDRSGLAHFFGPAAQNLAQDLHPVTVGISDQIDREQDIPTHGVDIAQGIGRRDRAELIGIVNDRREEIDRRYDRPFAVDTIDSGIVRLAQADQELRKRFDWE